MIFAGHRSEEASHGSMLKYLGLEPVLDLGMRLGEGTGGALPMGVMVRLSLMKCSLVRKP
ncbi:MAG: nicotinate-nucleotide--dimethylbenzimidazole phosphoribosyltransferase [Thermodesulfobacteriota bacterium]|nr:nicotinate-nucleotide--dimethylbenzimidazole phosphoribosyltransferase [Thermodesulfobacteriota bacterium]